MSFLDKYTPFLLTFLRVISGLMFLEHGTSKVFHFPFVANYADVVLGSWPEGIAGPLEVIFGLLIVLGLFSRIAAFLASGEMAIAYFLAHFPRSPFPVLNGGDSAGLYCVVFLYLAAAGPGLLAINRK